MPTEPADYVAITGAFVNPPGADIAEHNSEFVIVSNAGTAAVPIAGWKLRDLAGAETEVPPGYAIQPGGRLLIYTGPGVNTPDAVYGGRRRAMLNNRGDRLELIDDGGAVRQVFEY
jgi:glycerophosphoryl diester phosphodiesterase